MSRLRFGFSNNLGRPRTPMRRRAGKNIFLKHADELFQQNFINNLVQKLAAHELKL